MSEWISVEDDMPAIGQVVILYANGVVQKETFMLYAYDSSDYHMKYFWGRDDIDEGFEIASSHKWMPLPEPPSA